MQTLTPSQTPARRLAPLALIGLLVVCACGLLLASTASAADFTWSGGGSSTAWSDGANWVGGVAPTSFSSLGTLSFPLRPGLAQPGNNLEDLTVNRFSVDDSNQYSFSGLGFTLGSGGLNVSESVPGGLASLDLSTPITLAGDQTWDISGSDQSGQGVAIPAPSTLSGPTANLSVNLHNPNTNFSLGGGYLANMEPAPDDELGNVTITGVSSSSDQVLLDADLNTQDGHSLTVNKVTFFPNGGSGPPGATGPLTGIDAVLALTGASSVGPVTATRSEVDIHGTTSLPSVSLDAGSRLSFSVAGAGTQAGTDYSQLTSSGPIDLGGSSLALDGFAAFFTTGSCHSTAGQTDTLISTTGSLSGQFGNAPDGGTVTTTRCYDQAPGGAITGESDVSYRINYNTSGPIKTVTATALGPVPINSGLPIVNGVATEGQTLSASSGAWTNAPTSYAYQWQRCDSGGNNCQDISAASGSSYSLSVADVGSTIRAHVIASNVDGDSQPVVSAPTAVVQATGSGQLPPPPPPLVIDLGGGGNPPPVVGPGDPPPMTVAQITALLRQQFSQLTPPAGKAARIGALLKNGGLTMPFTSKVVGTLTVGWYQVASGAKVAKKTKAKPVLVASGKLTFRAAGTGRLRIGLTAAGRRLLGRARQVRLVAKGTFVAGGGVNVQSIRSIVVRR
jgi:hypothetical protein